MDMRLTVLTRRLDALVGKTGRDARASASLVEIRDGQTLIPLDQPAELA
ncbi:hypothetical protein ACIBSV_01830 [Embleya sp. NPDC050154]